MKHTAAAILAGAVLALAAEIPANADDRTVASREDTSGTIDVQLCDGETSTSVSADLERTPENGRKIAQALMTEWQRKNPETPWITAQGQSQPDPSPPTQPSPPAQSNPVATGSIPADVIEAEREKHTIKDPHDNSTLIGRGQGATYGLITKADVALWERQTLKFVARGSRVFHSADELGSTIAVSCDMCHPDASNTHPETYPKFQVQLGRVALLRDMINWCIEHPVRGQKLAEDDPRMRALEAYMYAQRSGTPLAYGKR